MSANLFQNLMRYKAWANDEILKALDAIDSGKYGTLRHRAIRVLNHTHVVDCIFAAHLLGSKHEYSATNTVETPTLDGLGGATRERDKWYIDYVDALPQSQYGELISFRFTDGDAGRMTREEILAHIVNHGAYHRGQVGRLLEEASASVPRDLFTGYLGLAKR